MKDWNAGKIGGNLTLKLKVALYLGKDVKPLFIAYAPIEYPKEGEWIDFTQQKAFAVAVFVL